MAPARGGAGAHDSSGGAGKQPPAPRGGDDGKQPPPGAASERLGHAANACGQAHRRRRG